MTIYRVPGLVSRDGASGNPFALPEMVVTPTGAMSKAELEAKLQAEYEAEVAELQKRYNLEGMAAKAWAEAEKRQREAMGRNAGDIHKGYGDALADAALIGGPEAHTMNAAEFSLRNLASRYTNYDLDRMMNDAWGSLGYEGQEKITGGYYQALKRRYPDADPLTLYNRARLTARRASDKRMYELAVRKNLPKGQLDYLMRKVGNMNLLGTAQKGLAVSKAGTTGDMAAYEEANERYRQDGHKVLDYVGMAAGFAADPTTWLSGAVGSGAARAALWAGGRALAGKGASVTMKKAAERMFSTTMQGRLAKGLAHGAGTFGALEGAKEVENQFAHGGHVVGRDDTGKYIMGEYSAPAILGQFAHGLGMGAAVGWLGPVAGNVSDRLVRGTGSTARKVAARAGVFTGSTVLEGTVFSVPEWIEGDRDGWDVWTDNLLMMGVFKAKPALRSAEGVLRDLKASFESRANGARNRLGFESRLRMRMDYSYADDGMGLTKDERAELARHGYNLSELVKSVDGQVATIDAPRVVDELTRMVKDTRVSEAARAKMYYYATGRKLPASSVMRGEMIEDGAGGYIVESQGANGVITSRTFKSRKAADLELERIKRQAELNSIQYGEQYRQAVDLDERMQDACRTVADENGWNPVDVYRICEAARNNYVRGRDKEFTEAQQSILDKVVDAMGEYEEAGATDAIRCSINEKYGVDIDGAIRKEARRRTEAEEKAIDEYITELFRRDESKVENPVMDAEAEDFTGHEAMLKLSAETKTSSLPDAVQETSGGVPVDFGAGDSFRVRMPGQAEGRPAIVMDREGDTVSVWSPEPITDKSDASITMDSGYVTELDAAELAGMLERDEQGNPVDYVAAEDGAEAEENPEKEEVNSGVTEYEDDKTQPNVGPFGEVYTQFRGKPQEAITYMLAKKSGEALGALYHKDVGDIDLVWGKEGTGHSDGYGLAKLAKYHPEVLFNLQDILNDMVVTKRTENRVQLESDKYQAAVRLTWDNEKKTWLLTMFEKKNSALDNTTDTGKTLAGNGNDTATPENTVVSADKDSNSASEKQAGEDGGSNRNHGSFI